MSGYIYQSQKQTTWQTLSQASKQASVNTYAQAPWSATWLTGGQNPSNNIAVARRFEVPSWMVTARLRFILKGASTCVAHAILYAYDRATGSQEMPAQELASFVLEAATDLPSEEHPLTGVTAAGWQYVNKITSTSITGVSITPIGVADAATFATGLEELRIALKGWGYLYMDFDCDAGGGTDSTDAIAFINGYSSPF